MPRLSIICDNPIYLDKYIMLKHYLTRSGHTLIAHDNHTDNKKNYILISTFDLCAVMNISAYIRTLKDIYSNELKYIIGFDHQPFRIREHTPIMQQNQQNNNQHNRNWRKEEIPAESIEDIDNEDNEDADSLTFSDYTERKEKKKNNNGRR